MENKTIFNKLTRDKVPKIIKDSGDIPEVEILDAAAYSKKLDEKLLEECHEVLSAVDIDSKIEEMADVIEVLYAMADVLGVTADEIEKVRLNKREERGAFEKKILLISTTP